MLDRFFIEKLACNINKIYKGNEIKRVSCSKYNIRLEFYVDKSNLILSAHPLFYGITQENKAVSISSVSGKWSELPILNKNIEGLIIKNVRCSDRDRVIFFDLGENIQVICNLFGRNSNILITKINRIEWSLNEREEIGRVYSETKKIELPGAYDIGIEGIIEIINRYKSFPLYKVISSNIREITPDTAKFLIEYICLSPEINIDDVSDDDIKALYSAILDYCNAYKSEITEFRILKGLSGNLYLSPLKSSDCMMQVNSEYTSPLRLLSKYHGLIYEYTEKQSLERKSILEIKRRRRRLEEKIKEVEERLSECKLFDSVRHKGDIVMANLHILKKGDELAVLPDSAEEGNLIEIELDPSLAPYENAVRYYKKAKKMEKSLKRIPEEIKKMKDELEGLPEPDSISELDKEELNRIISRGIAVRKLKGRPERRDKEFSGLHILKVEVRTGVVIYIGRDARSNEYVTFRLAKGNDLWFHAFERHGSHLVLKLQKGREPSGDDIIMSAKLAAYFSKGRSEGKVEVVYTQAKYVKKTKVVGRVSYSNNKSVIVKPASIEDSGLNAIRL